MLSPAFIISVLFGEKEVWEETLLNSFYRYLPPGDEVLVREAFKASEDKGAFDDEDLIDLLCRYACRKRPTKENVRDLILELAHKELIQRPQYIADCWHALLGKNCKKTDWSTAAKVYKQYESLEPTTKKCLVWWRQCPAAIVNARHWITSRNSLEAWISRNLNRC